MNREKLNTEDYKDIEDEEEVRKTTGRLRALILTPTRELAVQIKDHIMVIMDYEVLCTLSNHKNTNDIDFRYALCLKKRKE